MMKCSIFKGRFKYIAIFCLSFLLSSCIEVKQSIKINKDGSGDARLEIAIQKEWAPQIMPRLKSEAPRGWNIVEEREKEGKQVIAFGKKFKSISELNDDEAGYSFSTERAGFLKKFYLIRIKQLKSSDMPFPYEFTIRVPGSINETNETKLSSNEVKWSLPGLQKGKELSVKSSALTMPNFASLKESFNKVFYSPFYREAIIFLRDRNLWVMDSDGKNQRQLTKEGVGHWSVSRDGKIVFDRFDPSHRDKKLTDLNIYYVVLPKIEESTKLTNDDKNMMPEISPDGTKVIFQKFRLGGKDYYGEGEGIWLINLASGKQEEVVSFVAIPDEIRRKEKELIARVSGRLGTGEFIDDKRWVRERNLMWSPDAKKVAFSRSYSNAIVTYIVNLDDHHVMAPPYEAQPYAKDICSTKILLSKLEDTYDTNLWLYDFETRKGRFLSKHVIDDAVKFSSDCKKIAFAVRGSKNADGLWIADSMGKGRRQISSFEPTGMAWHGGNRRIIFTTFSERYDLRLRKNVPQTEIWVVNDDGSEEKKIADSGSSAKWTLIPRISFVSLGMVRIIILTVLALSGIFLFFCMAVITRKVVRAIIPKGKVISKGIFCGQCGKENSPSASFCTNCGQRLN